MAQVDTGIYQNLLRPVKSVQEYDAEAQQAEGNKLALLLQRGQYDAQQRGVADETAFRSALGAPDANLADASFQRRLMSINPAKAQAIIKGNVDQQSAQAKLTKDQYDAIQQRFQIAGQIIGGVTDQASWDRARQQTAQVFGPEAAAQMPAQYDPRLIEEKRLQALDAKAQFEQHWKGIESNQKDRQLTEAERNNKVQNGIAAGQLGVAQGQLGVARKRLALDQSAPKGQIVQTDQGTMVVDPRTGNAVPAMGPGGVPLTKPLKDIPANVNTAIITNAQNLNKINQAIDLLDGKTVGSLKGDKEATGWKGYAPQGILNRMDPNGVDTRAMISDIGSLVLHDRSGAAVTASESPRLLPFIPLATDDAETAKKKLTRFKQLYEQEQQAFADTYGKDQGYRASPVKPTTSTVTPNGGGLSPDAIAAELKRRGH